MKMKSKNKNNKEKTIGGYGTTYDKGKPKI